MDRLPGAIANAKAYGREGAKFPWMSCGSGDEATTSQGNVSILGKNEIHESGDVVFAAQQHWRYGNFDIIFDQFSRVSQRHPTPHAPRHMPCLVPMLIGW